MNQIDDFPRHGGSSFRMATHLARSDDSEFEVPVILGGVIAKANGLMIMRCVV